MPVHTCVLEILGIYNALLFSSWYNKKHTMLCFFSHTQVRQPPPSPPPRLNQSNNPHLQKLTRKSKATTPLPQHEIYFSLKDEVVEKFVHCGW